MPYKLWDSGAKVEVPRVTEVIRRGMPKSKVIEWDLNRHIIAALEHPPTKALKRASRVAAVRRRCAMDDRAARRGTRVHAAIARYYLTGEPGTLLAADEPLFARWLEWARRGPWVDVQGGYVEQTVCALDHSFAGTLDLMTGDTVVDWKTTDDCPAEPYPDNVAQLGAYSAARLIVDEDRVITGEWMPKVTRGLLVYISPRGVRPYPVDIARAQELFGAVKRVAEARP
jgi:hypothetical protein